MAPKFVVSYRMSDKRGKNDAAGAAAICEAATRPNVPVTGAAPASGAASALTGWLGVAPLEIDVTRL